MEKPLVSDMQDSDVTRIEKQLEKLTEAVTLLARVDERTRVLERDVSDLDTRVAVNTSRINSTDTVLNRWINRGIGAWAVVGGAVTIFGFLKYFAAAAVVAHGGP